MSHAHQGVGVARESQPPTVGPRGRDSSGRAWGMGVGAHCAGRGARAEEETPQLSSEPEGEQAATRETQDRSGSEDGTGARVRFWEQGPQMLSQHLRCLRYLDKIHWDFLDEAVFT